MDNNLLTPSQLSSYAPPKSVAPPVSTNLLSPAQLASYSAKSNTSNPASNVGSSWDAYDKAMNTKAPSSEFLHPLDALSTQYNSAISTAKEGVSSGADTMAKGGAGNIVHGAAQAGLGATSGAVGATFAPFSASANAIVPGKGFLSDVAKGGIVGGELGSIIPGAGTVAGAGIGALFGGGIHVVNAVKDAILAHSSISDADKAMINNAINTGLAIIGEKVGNAKSDEGLNAPVSDVAGQVKQIPGQIKAGVSNAKDAIVSGTKGVIGKVAPTETLDTTAGKVLQGKSKDVESGKNAITLLDKPETIKTYKDLNSSASSKIKDLATKQDVILSKDKTTHPIDNFEKITGEGNSQVKTNYVKQAIDNLKELYTNTSDAKGLSEIKTLEEKVYGISDKLGNLTKEPVGLTVKEVNQLARDYGSEFSSKAFGKTGEPLTSVNATKFENIRSGLKNTARDLLPSKESQQLDSQMTDLYGLRDSAKTMAEKVNTLTQRLKQVNILQKIGGTVGKALRVTGIGDLAGKLLGIDKVPGASTLNAVELEQMLSKNIARINAALTKDDAGFVSSIKDIINHPK